jgi:membrane associated rhomboid family serine protease
METLPPSQNNQVLPSSLPDRKARISAREIWEVVAWPLLFVVVLWVIECCFIYFDLRLPELGIHPRDLQGSLGILTCPFVHANMDHLLSNTIPLLVVGSGIVHFYKEIKLKVITMIWLLTGFWVWLIARPEYHIGASGLIYGGVVFLFFSGVFRKDVRLMSISMLVVFLYGSLAWGILPVDPTQSWESHLSGSVAGLFTAIYFRREKPYRAKYQWELDEEQEAMKQNAIPSANDATPMMINYHFIPEEKKDDGENRL